MKKKLWAMSVAPIIMMTLCILVFTGTLVKTRLEKDAESTLKGVACAVLAAYDQNAGDYMETEDGEVWKGAYNISKSEELVDSIKESSDVDVTFCYGTKRIVTSAKDNNGDKIVGSAVGDAVAEQVLKKGKALFTEDVLVGDTEYYGYYLPVVQNGSDEVVGMIFAGMPHTSGLKTYYSILKTLLIVSLCILALISVTSLLVAGSISRAVGAASDAVKTVAAGQLGFEIDAKYMHRKDEVGALCKAVDGMRNELRYIIEDVNKNTQELIESADSLDSNAKSTMGTVDSVDRAVNEIADGATAQAKDTMRATENVGLMGDMLAASGREIENLNRNAEVMQESSQKATDSLKELMRINEEVMQSIDLIYEQTNRTNESSQRIKEATNIISNISEETNLLSLNASIEAARAGEQGRGFAVVANEIQHLAEQSGSSTDAIAAMVSELIADSNMAVETMNKVHDVIALQSSNLEDTSKVVEAVIEAVENSAVAIRSIEEQSRKLDAAKNEIVEVVSNLSAVAEENAASTEETSAATTEVAGSFDDVAKSADSLKQIADNLANVMGTFKLD